MNSVKSVGWMWFGWLDQVRHAGAAGAASTVSYNKLRCYVVGHAEAKSSSSWPNFSPKNCDGNQDQERPPRQARQTRQTGQTDPGQQPQSQSVRGGRPVPVAQLPVPVPVPVQQCSAVQCQ